MTTVAPSRFLRLALVGDALASGATGLLLATGAGPLETLLGLPGNLMRPCDAFLVGYAVAVAWLGRKPIVRSGAVWFVIAINALWALDSALLLANGTLSPTTLGFAFMIAQAFVVAAFAELQYIGLRRASAGLIPVDA